MSAPAQISNNNNKKPRQQHNSKAFNWFFFSSKILSLSVFGVRRPIHFICAALLTCQNPSSFRFFYFLSFSLFGLALIARRRFRRPVHHRLPSAISVGWSVDGAGGDKDNNTPIRVDSRWQCWMKSSHLMPHAQRIWGGARSQWWQHQLHGSLSFFFLARYENGWKEHFLQRPFHWLTTKSGSHKRRFFWT